VPLRYRLFDSVVVFQNYIVDESARRLGHEVRIEEFTGPIHTAYPVLLLVQPGAALGLTLIYDRRRIARAAVEHWAADLSALLQRLPGRLDSSVADLQSLMTTAVGPGSRPTAARRPESQNYVPPQSEMERCIADVLQGMFGLERVSIDDNFFDLGGHSLLLLQTHGRLRKALNTEFPIVTLFAHPTVRALATHLGRPAHASGDNAAFRERAERGKQALARLRERRPALK
jgi:acyl carrier protein